MSRFQQIRDFLAANPEPQSSRDIGAAVGVDPTRICYTICAMVRDGWLAPHGSSKPMRYTLLRAEKVKRQRQTEQERSQRRRKREREREQARATMSPDQYQQWLVECAQRTQAQKEADQAEALRIQRLASEIRAANKARAKREAQAKQENDAAERREVARAGRAIKLDALASPDVSQVAPPETVDEWMARTGKRPQRLAAGAVSPLNRLRYDYA